MSDWQDIFRPAVAGWVLGELAAVPERVLLPCENPDYYDDGGVAALLEKVERRERFLLGTFRGVPVAVAGPKFGSPAVAMAVDVLAASGARVVIGVGYCGALQPEIACGDLVIATGAVRDEGTTPHYVPLSYPALAHPAVVAALTAAAGDLGVTHHPGVVWTTDAVLCEDDAQVRLWHEARVLGVDMETAALLAIAALRGAHAGAVLVASDNPHLKCPTDLTRLRNGYRTAVEVALRAAASSEV